MKEAKVKVVLLNSGVSVVFEDDGSGMWKNCYVPELRQTPQGVLLTFQPFMTFRTNQEMLPLNREQYMVIYTPDTSFVAKWHEYHKHRRAQESGIITPGPKNGGKILNPFNK